MKIIFEEIFPEAVYVYDKIIDIPILDTDELNIIIDKYRIEQGKRPFYTGNNPDLDGWYNIRILINYETGDPIRLQVVTENDEDCDTTTYFFDIDNKEDVKEQIKRELKKYSITIDELVKERK